MILRPGPGDWELHTLSFVRNYEESELRCAGLNLPEPGDWKLGATSCTISRPPLSSCKSFDHHRHQTERRWTNTTTKNTKEEAACEDERGEWRTKGILE